jgi:hypothetical protein
MYARENIHGYGSRPEIFEDTGSVVRFFYCPGSGEIITHTNTSGV